MVIDRKDREPDSVRDTQFVENIAKVMFTVCSLIQEFPCNLRIQINFTIIAA